MRAETVVCYPALLTLRAALCRRGGRRGALVFDICATLPNLDGFRARPYRHNPALACIYCNDLAGNALTLCWWLRRSFNKRFAT